MILAGMDLPEHSADARPIIANHDKQILYNKANRRQLVDDFHVREALLVRANFVLALHDINTFWFQHSISLDKPRVPL